jgi:gamma-glutamyltranspeptidase/glutathione hydrolase
VTPISGAYRDHEIVELPPNGQGAAVLAALARRDREPAGEPGAPDTVVAVIEAIREGMQLAQRHVADPRHADVVPFWGGHDTVYTAVQADGMGVSLITSVFWAFGTGITAGGCALQNRGAGFTVREGHPNVVAPGKRPFHTIIPALVRRNHRPWAVFGLVGGPMQPQGQVQVLSHLIDHGADAQAALDAPRARWFGGSYVALEPGFAPEVHDAVRASGFELLDDPAPGEWGGGQLVRVHDDGWLEGGSDPRQDGVAFGV